MVMLTRWPPVPPSLIVPDGSPASLADPVAPTIAVSLEGVGWGPKGQGDILSDITFDVAQGQIVAVCGANGAGKSSLLRLIYRHQAPRRGSVRLFGRDIWRMGASEAARSLAVVLQEQPTDLGLTARQIVALGRLPHRRGWGAGQARDADAAIVEASLMLSLIHI